jgi:hypothetical protein
MLIKIIVLWSLRATAVPYPDSTALRAPG